MSIRCWSRSLTRAEKNYSDTEKECLAVVCVLLTLRPCLNMEGFTVHTGHASMLWLMNINDASGRLMLQRLRLGAYDFDFQYKEGLKNCQADTLPRPQKNLDTPIDIDSDIPCLLSERVDQNTNLQNMYSSKCSETSGAHA